MARRFLHLHLLLFFVLFLGDVRADAVTYDGRSLIINGERKILFSGSIHYPRSTPEMWPSLISKAKDGGLDVIQTYVFWNLHEPQQGQYDFSGRNDLVRFIKEIQAQGLYVSLRIGPFVEAEWTYGGFPVWLRDIPNIVFRTDNEPFKAQMQKFTSFIVNMMKAQNLYAPQGGPIIISQIENEYGNIERAFGPQGPSYVQWAAAMAVSLQTGVPWVMCKQDDAPAPVINTCNGMKCGETFRGPNSPNKPSMWTENWTSFLQAYGEQPYIRTPQVLAFHVALFIAKNGSFVNYYMYHGGTNFGRTAASYMITSYYDQAPIDEYGLIRQPKWGHLKELHDAVKSCSDTLLSSVPKHYILATSKEAFVFGDQSGKCAAFLMNNSTGVAKVIFQNTPYVLPAKSISILPDCKTEAFNTAKVSTKGMKRVTTKVVTFKFDGKWKEYRDNIPNYDETTLHSNTLLDQIRTTNDTTDYLWYTLSFHRDNPDNQATLKVTSMGHVLRAFVNGAFVGSAHGGRAVPSFTLTSKVSLISGTNNISLLSGMVGLPDAGPHLERRIAGLQSVKIWSNKRSVDFSNNAWGYQVGLNGENSKAFSDQEAKTQWGDFTSNNQPFTWYKTTFDAPQGNDPLALNLASMGKGEAWINGQSIGRYWVSFLTPTGHSSQLWYNVPRSFIKPKGNSVVLMEEESGDPRKISIDKISIRPARLHASNISLAPSNNSSRDNKKCEEYKQKNKKPNVELKCPPSTRQSIIL